MSAVSILINTPDYSQKPGTHETQASHYVRPSGLSAGAEHLVVCGDDRACCHASQNFGMESTQDVMLALFWPSVVVSFEL